MQIKPNKNIFFVNQSPNKMLVDIARSYSDKGYSCDLICGRKNLLAEKELLVFSDVKKIQSYKRSSVFSRVFTWLSFTLHCLFLLVVKLSKGDTLFIVSNPPFNLLMAPLIKLFRNVNITYLVYDLYPDVITSMYTSFPVRLVSKIIGLVNSFSFHYVNHVFVPSHSLAIAVGKYTRSKISVIYNWVDADQIIPVDKNDNLFLRTNNLKDKFIVLYSGNFGMTHDIETVLTAAKIVGGKKNICFVFIGDGEGMMEVKKVIQQQHPGILYFSWQPENLFKYSIASGDVALVSYNKNAHNFSIPSKLPFYFATGTPVISIGSTNSEISSLIIQNKVGYAIENGESKELAKLIIELSTTNLSQQKVNAEKLAKKNFSVTNAEKFIV